jgi:hypothetical protein
MDLRRLRGGEWLTGAAGTLLLVSLFLPWYERETPCPPLPGSGESACEPLETIGWDSFAVLDLVFAVAAALALALVVVTATQRTVAVPIATSALVCLAGLIVTALAAWRVLDLPSEASERAAGAFVGLIACAGITAGGALSMRDERLRPGTDATGRPIAPRAEIERLPAPPPGGAREAGP